MEDFYHQRIDILMIYVMNYIYEINKMYIYHAYNIRYIYLNI